MNPETILKQKNQKLIFNNIFFGYQVTRGQLSDSSAIEKLTFILSVSNVSAHIIYWMTLFTKIV